MKTILYTLIFCLAGISVSFAQNKTTYNDSLRQAPTLEKVRTTAFTQNARGAQLKARKGVWHPGGSFGMAFGNNRTTLNITPQIGYSQNPYFTVGGGLNYSYFHSSRHDYNLHYAGINIYGRVTPLPLLAFQVQPELMERWGKSGGHSVSGRLVPTLLVGGGIVLPLIKGGINVMFYYDVLQNDYTPYSNNVFYSVGYTFSF